ncbi:MAG: hypothetical protein U1A78_03905 [Polyangia bacterium]
MRRTRSVVSSLAGPLLGLGALLVGSGCGQLWRPFLETIEPTACDPGAAYDGCGADLGVPQDLGPPGPWEVIPTNTPYALRAIWGYDTEQAIFLGGDAGTFLSWRPATGVQPEVLPPRVKPEVINAMSGWNLATAPGPVVAAGAPNVLMYYTGSQWRDMAPTTPVGTALNGVALTQPGYLFAAGDQGALYSGMLGGTLSVARVGPSGLGLVTGVATADPSTVWITLATGEIFLANANGTTTRFLEYTGKRLNGIWAGKPIQQPLDMGSVTYPYVVGTADTVARYNSKDFVQEPLPTGGILAHEFVAACGNGKGEVWVVGRRGVVFYFNTREWAELSTGLGEDLLGAWVASGSSRPWVVGDKGQLLHLRTLRTGA